MRAPGYLQAGRAAPDNDSAVETMEAIATRRSVGRLGGDVTRAETLALIDAATWAPNHHLTEPWRFTVVEGAARERIGRGWAIAAAEEMGVHADAREKFIAGESRKLLRAPVVVFVSTRVDDDPTVASEDYAATSAAIQNMLLAAHARGLGAIWRTGKMASAPAMRGLLGLPAGERIVGAVYIGRPEGALPERRGRASPRVRWID